MKISDHAKNTEQLIGLRAEDIHKWIDGFFDYENFSQFLLHGKKDSYDPYEHRQYRHCSDALEEAYREFEHAYTREQIKIVFESHVKDDYNGYIPRRSDFINGTFKEKYHETETDENDEPIFSEAELRNYFSYKKKAATSHKQGNMSHDFILKILLPICSIFILFIYVLFVVVLPQSRDNMMTVKKEMIKELTATAQALIAKHSKTTASTEHAQQQALEELRGLRHGPQKKYYFWVTNDIPYMLMHPINPELEGQDVSEYTDKKSHKNIFSDFVALVQKNGEGYAEYYWQKDDSHHKKESKLSYVCLIPEWNWILGTGIYLDDVEHEMDRLTQSSMTITISVLIILLIIMSYTALQSYRLEQNKQHAEKALLEAKNRYRALVEASNEGYVLEIGGKNVYCNARIMRMLGYSADELEPIEIWDTLLIDSPINTIGRQHLQEFFLDHVHSIEFEAQLQTNFGTLVHVIIRTSRIFLNNTNGHLISLRQVVANKNFSQRDPLPTTNVSAEYFIREIALSQSDGHIIHTLNQLPSYIQQLLHTHHISEARHLVSQTFAQVSQRFMEMTLEEHDECSCDFALISLGSHAREEMTIFSDQDTGIIFRSTNDTLLDNKQQLVRLANTFCQKLNKAGYPYCPGGIMAMNPAWCLSVDEWKQRFHKSIYTFSPDDAPTTHLLFDMQTLYGNDDLLAEINCYKQECIHAAPQFFKYYALECVQYKVPVSPFGNVQPTKEHGEQLINLKTCLMPIVLFARIYSLKHAIQETQTLKRLQALQVYDILNQERIAEITRIFDDLWSLRFHNQIHCHTDLQTVNDEMNISDLSVEERDKIAQSLMQIAKLTTHLSYDFLGVST